MNENLLEILVDPHTHSELTLHNVVGKKGTIDEGFLISVEGREYPIIKGIPRFVEAYASEDEKQTVEAFGFQWSRFRDFKQLLGSDEHFLATIAPVKKSDIEGKVVLDAGCGGGRLLSHFADSGARRVVGVDFSRSVEQASEIAKDYKNIDIVQASIYSLPFKKAFDLVFSIGVIHHLEDPFLGFIKLGCLVKEGGALMIWVYAREGNQSYIKVLKSFQRIASHLGFKSLIALCIVLSTPLHVIVHCLNPLLRRLRIKLPLSDYMEDILRKHTFQQLVLTVHDQLAPSLVKFLSRDDLQTWLRKAPYRIDEVELSLYHGNSWRCLTRPHSGENCFDLVGDLK